MTGGSSRLLASFGAATLLHLALIPLLGWAFGGDGSPGGGEWRRGVVLELIRPETSETEALHPPEPPAPAAKAAAMPAPAHPSVPAPAAVARADVPRREDGVPRGRRVPPRTGRGTTGRAVPPDPSPSALVAVADPRGVASDVGLPVTGGMSGPSGAAPASAAVEGTAPSEAPSESQPGTDEAQAGCTQTAAGVVCSVEQSDVLNRPQSFMGMVVDPGYEERGYVLEPESGGYVYRADSHNAVHIAPDGSIDVESGPKPSDALCILGGAPLPWDIPELPQYQYDELEQATAGLRADMADRQDRSWQYDALDGLAAELEAIVSRGDRTPAEQRRFLFQRWDECTESGGGLDARRIIEELIRRRYPQGGSLGYGDAELAELNGDRDSSMRFCPYGCASAEP
ncbi:MAG: hypothetical protein HY905_22150 [Deltaproteobacteria bacterium]|nr:hypothetical protein [Deltaproteobacteria bacterium]